MAATVTYNGQSNNFTGEGSPNPQKLVIPYKDRMDPQMKAAMLQIEQFVNNLIAPTGSGGYASLTGPGETATPGKLTQLGDFTVQDVGPGGTGVQLETSDQLPIFLSASDGTVGGNLATITLSTTGSADVNIQAGTGSGANIAVTSTGVGPGDVSINAQTLHLNVSDIGFYGATPAPQPTIGGSRSGNAALADLLTHLATLGLIIDSTTP